MDFNPVLFGGAPDALFNGFDFICIVLSSVVLVVHVVPGGAHMLRCINRILVVGRVSKLDVTILVLASSGFTSSRGSIFWLICILLYERTRSEAEQELCVGAA
jgi:hypothetical protein